MDENYKKMFRNEYGKDKYRIINKYNLWNLDPYILGELGSAVLKYLGSRSFSEKKYIFSDSEKHYIDIFGLKNLDEESLSDLDKAISYLIFFRMEEFENPLEVFKEKINEIRIKKIK